jgi:hypothetical protein
VSGRESGSSMGAATYGLVYDAAHVSHVPMRQSLSTCLMVRRVNGLRLDDTVDFEGYPSSAEVLNRCQFCRI